GARVLPGMNQVKSIAFAVACATVLGGCISLFPMPGSGKKKEPQRRVEVDGKVFGTGTMVVDEWAVTLLVDPASVEVVNTAEQLRVNSAKGGNLDPVNGDFEFWMRPKKPGETKFTRLAEVFKELNIKRKPANFGAAMASFDIPAIQDVTEVPGF